MKIPTLQILAAAAVMAGCASPTPRFDAAFGQAVMQAKARQTLDPQASLNQDPATGIEGGPAADGIGRYYETFRTPPQTFDIIINTGAAGGR